MRVGRCGLGMRHTLEGVPTLEGGVEQNRTTSPEVIISGRNARSTVVGFLNVLTGRLVRTARQRARGEDIAAGVQALGDVEVRGLLIRDGAPPHQALGSHAGRPKLWAL
jgi:hypothetical protein